jgi:multidrug efflux pump subunit AcrA (membrane-fusion protein)
MINSNSRNAGPGERSLPGARALLAALLLTAALPAAVRSEDGDAVARLDADIQKAKAEIAQAKKEVQKAEAELRKTDSLAREEASRAAEAESRRAKDRERREKENTALQARMEETQAKINAERSGMGRWQNAEDEPKARQKRLALVLAGYCDSVAARIEAGLPWEREGRVNRIKSLKKDLETGSASVEEGFARLNAAI